MASHPIHFARFDAPLAAREGPAAGHHTSQSGHPSKQAAGSSLNRRLSITHHERLTALSIAFRQGSQPLAGQFVGVCGFHPPRRKYVRKSFAEVPVGCPFHVHESPWCRP